MEGDGLGVEYGLIFVEEGDILGDAVFEDEFLLLVDPLVDEDDFDAGVEEGELAEALAEEFVFELAGGGEDLRVGREGDACAGAAGIADDFHLLLRDAAGKLHLVDFAVAAHFDLEPLGNCVDTLCADSV